MQWFKQLIRKLVNMARPRVITTSTGAEVKMTGLDPALADKVKALVSGQTLETIQETIAQASPIDPAMLENTSLGTFKDADGVWKLVVIKFSATTKEAAIERVMPCGTDREDAAEKFKIEAVNLGMV